MNAIGFQTIFMNGIFYQTYVSIYMSVCVFLRHDTYNVYVMKMIQIRT